MNLSELSLPLLAGMFVAGALAIWFAGIQLSNTTDVLSKRFKLGEALGGAIVLAIVTNLPEIAITVSAAIKNNISLAIGNILGGIALQTVVLVVLDVFGLGKKSSLTYKASSMPLIIEALFVVGVLALVVMGHQLPGSLIFLHITPAGLLIAICWVVGLWLVNTAGKGLPWTAQQEQNDNRQGAKRKNADDTKPTGKLVAIFLIAALVTLIAGVALELSSDAIAKQIHVDGLIFGATVLALATSLPEISTGLAAVKLEANEMAMSDIFGGNGFLPVLFLVATAITGKAALPQAQKSDIYLTCLGILLTLVYIVGMIFRSKKQVLHMGLDSMIVLLVYLAGIGGLFFIAGK